MSKRFLFAVAAVLLACGGTTAAELAVYEVTGLPITPHQLATLGPANAEEQAPTPRLALSVECRHLRIRSQC
ncbi:hypothetical protein Q2941_45450 [Bradyrhizobium sp. UFLA05-153]